MYTGGNKIALHSQKLIADSMMCLLREKDYEEITVSALCQEAGISRQTFYALFGSRENVIHFEITHNCAYPADMKIPPNATVAGYLAKILSQYIWLNQDLLTLLTEKGLTYELYLCCKEWILRDGTFLPDAVPEGQTNYLGEFVAATVTGVINVFVSEKKRKSARELEELLCALLDGSILRKPM